MDNKETDTKKNSKSSPLPQPPEQTEKSPRKNGEKVVIKSGFQKTIQTIGIGLLLLLAGFITCTLVFYLPTVEELREAQSKIERLGDIETQLNNLQKDYDLVNKKISIYKTISDASLLDTALSRKDSTRISQQLRYIEEDLGNLMIPEFPEVTNRLQSQYKKIESQAVSDPETAWRELQTFLNDLLLLADNIK